MPLHAQSTGPTTQSQPSKIHINITPTAVDPTRVGVLLPLSGKQRRVGEVALRGLTLATGKFDEEPGRGVLIEGIPRPFTLVVRDSAALAASQPATDVLTQHLTELKQQGVVAVVGPIDKEIAAQAASRAKVLDLLLISLDVGEAKIPEGAPTVRVVLSVEARARALAAHALQHRLRKFVILAPDMAYGARGARAFQAAVERARGTVLATLRYPKNATTFTKQIKDLKKQTCDAVFVPDTADRLELLTPQLAALDVRIKPLEVGADEIVAEPASKLRRKNKPNKPITLLSTAEALTPKFLRAAGRYAVGAVLAPGFYLDDEHPRLQNFIESFRAAYEQDPTMVDAYAYDAALVLRAAVEAGARTPQAMVAYLRQQAIPGMTGNISFDTKGQRSDPGLLFVVKSADEIGIVGE